MISFLYNPMATSSVVAIFICTLALIVVVKARVAIGCTLAGWRAQIFTRTGFFWIVNLVFMGVSVLHAGDFFGITGKDDFARGLGFAVSFFLDLVTIILMQAMLEARYRGEEARGRQFLFFIMLCCGTSTFANLAISLNDFDPGRYLPHAPMWVQIATPYVLASFPLFVIMMSIASEMIINVRPLEQLDEREYEADEKKRLNLMTIRNAYAQKQAEQELLAIEIANKRLDNKRMRRSAFSFRQRQPPPHVAQAVDVEAIKASLIDSIKVEIKASYEPQIASLKFQLEQARDRRDDQPEQDIEPPISLEDWRYKDGHSGAIDQAVNGNQVALQDVPDDSTTTPIDVAIVAPISYDQIREQWDAQGIKSVSVDGIVRATGLSIQKVARNKQRFKRTPKNPDLYTVSSVLPWLKEILQEPA